MGSARTNIRPQIQPDSFFKRDASAVEVCGYHGMTSRAQVSSPAQSASGTGDAAGSTLSTKVGAVPAVAEPLTPPAECDRSCPCASCSAIKKRFDLLLILGMLLLNPVLMSHLFRSATSPPQAARLRQNELLLCLAAAPSVVSIRIYRRHPVLPLCLLAYFTNVFESGAL